MNGMITVAKNSNNEEFIKYCLNPAVEMRAIVRKQLSILDSEYPCEMSEYASLLETEEESGEVK